MGRSMLTWRGIRVPGLVIAVVAASALAVAAPLSGPADAATGAGKVVLEIR